MKIKNYTSGVPVSRTVARIEAILAKAGADGIQKQYEGRRLKSIVFKINVPEHSSVAIRLPANGEAVYQTLKAEVKKPRTGTMENLRDQAERTAWKLMQDWVQIQLSLISMQQVQFLEVFLPFIWDGKKTFFDRVITQDLLQLGPAKKE